MSVDQGNRMAEHHTDNGKRTSHGVGVGHEASTMRIGPIFWFLIALGGGTVVICLLMAGLFDSFEKNVTNEEGKLSPLAGERQKLPPEPRLQLAPSTTEQLQDRQSPNLKLDHPLQEMKRLRDDENKKLSSFGWVDEKAGVVRIPIEEAKKKLLQNGIQTRK
jgi:hypothetical protein